MHSKGQQGRKVKKVKWVAEMDEFAQEFETRWSKSRSSIGNVHWEWGTDSLTQIYFASKFFISGKSGNFLPGGLELGLSEKHK